jgi:hypothetical protein
MPLGTSPYSFVRDRFNTAREVWLLSPVCISGGFALWALRNITWLIDNLWPTLKRPPVIQMIPNIPTWVFLVAGWVLVIVGCVEGIHRYKKKLHKEAEHQRKSDGVAGKLEIERLNSLLISPRLKLELQSLLAVETTVVMDGHAVDRITLIVFCKILSGHLKTGQWRSPQNRPMEKHSGQQLL